MATATDETAVYTDKREALKAYLQSGTTSRFWQFPKHGVYVRARSLHRARLALLEHNDPEAGRMRRDDWDALQRETLGELLAARSEKE